MKSVVGMGTLYELVVRTKSGDRSIRPRDYWLAWDPSTRNLIIGKKRKGHGTLSPAVRAIHKKFHTAESRSTSMIEFPDGAAQGSSGLLVSLTYRVPRGIASPQKNPYTWVHKFGDHGELGHGKFREGKEYPESVMPLLVMGAGKFWIKRRRGNRYFVTDWLYW
jgi:hypothetical protein